jgi:ADP-ribose pyrophosphatase YjhB (NUDIX family)
MMWRWPPKRNTVPSVFKPRHTARGIVVHNGKILLIERWRPRLHYFSIPGGGIEKGETAEETVIRELQEETTIIATVYRQVLEMHDGGHIHKIYLCKYVSGEPHMSPDAPEAQHGPENRFEPGWVPIADLDSLPFTYWQPLKQPLIDGLHNGFAESVKIVNAPSSR